MKSIEWWFSLALWVAALGHFIMLCASFQAPYFLKWKEDLAKLTRFNRSIFWVYGGYIAMTIMAFGLLTIYLHDDMLRGDKASLALALFMGIFWGARVLIDFFVYKTDDWPTGLYFDVGHLLVRILILGLAGTYLGLVSWHLLG
ncbi:MAG: hypothetical protein COB53_10145 [Elusimicrobia bacterium]|nr:MAG: hypothetical protein COB53_10145 [Elusimicrobiota bacterium]